MAAPCGGFLRAHRARLSCDSAGHQDSLPGCALAREGRAIRARRAPRALDGHLRPDSAVEPLCPESGTAYVFQCTTELWVSGQLADLSTVTIAAASDGALTKVVAPQANICSGVLHRRHHRWPSCAAVGVRMPGCRGIHRLPESRQRFCSGFDYCHASCSLSFISVRCLVCHLTRPLPI